MQTTTYPWLNIKRWENGRITSHGKVALYVLLAFVVVWNLISVPVIVAQWTGLLDIFERLVIDDFGTYDRRLMLLLMPAANLFLVPPLIRRWRQWSKFGRLYMTLDPYPGAIGGQIGGYLDIPAIRYRHGMAVDVRVNCVKVSISRSGKSRTRSDSVVWRKRAKAELGWGSGGTRVEFVVDIDEDLPQSTPEPAGNGNVYWSVRVRLPEAGFDRSYDIPVFKTERGVKSAIRLSSLSDDDASRSVADLPGGLAEIEQAADGFAIHYPPGRSGNIGNLMMLFGAIFFGAAIFLGFQFAAEFDMEAEGRVSLFSAAMLGMMSCVFGLVSCGIIAAGWFVKTNRLRVIVDRDGLMTERQVFGRTFRRLAARTEISAFDKKVTMQSGQGAQAEIYYSILARKTDGQTLTVGDHIHGQEDADVLLDFFRRHVAVATDGAFPDSTHRPALPPQIKWLVAGVKAFSFLIFIGMMAAFILDFAA